MIWSAYEHHITSNFLKAVRPHHFKSLKRPFLNTLIHIQLLLHLLVGQKEKIYPIYFVKKQEWREKQYLHKISGHFQDKTSKFWITGQKKKLRAFPGLLKFPRRVDTQWLISKIRWKPSHTGEAVLVDLENKCSEEMPVPPKYKFIRKRESGKSVFL